MTQFVGYFFGFIALYFLAVVGVGIFKSIKQKRKVMKEKKEHEQSQGQDSDSNTKA